jgi:hypothetical protein
MGYFVSYLTKYLHESCGSAPHFLTGSQYALYYSPVLFPTKTIHLLDSFVRKLRNYLKRSCESVSRFLTLACYFIQMRKSYTKQFTHETTAATRERWCGVPWRGLRDYGSLFGGSVPHGSLNGLCGGSLRCFHCRSVGRRHGGAGVFVIHTSSWLDKCDAGGIELVCE